VKTGSTEDLPFSNIRKILIRSTNWVGDAVLTLPAISSVRLTFPQSNITVLANKWVSQVFRSNPDIDEIILYDEAIYKGFLGKWRLIALLRERGFDLAILLQNAFGAALITYMAGIPFRLGYNTDGRGILLTHAVDIDKATLSRHQIDYYLQMLSTSGFSLAERILQLNIADEDMEEAGHTLERFGISEGDLIVGISPGATYGPAKRWLPDRFAALADKLIDNFGARVLIFGSQKDSETALQVIKNSKRRMANLVGQTTLTQAEALVSRCQLFITNDSGLMHVASALRVPVVAIFGSTNPETTSPFGEGNVIIRKDIPCSPCLKKECPEGYLCMKLITVDEVYEQVTSILTKNYGC
jgi:heptosyltransferase-2